MISCEAAVRQLWDLIENDLDPADRQKVDEHLAFCRTCCGELEFAQELRRFMAEATAVDMPPGVQERFESLLDDLETRGAP